MTKFVLAIAAALFFSGCGSTAKNQAVEPDIFENKEGCFLLFNMQSNAFDKVVGGEACKKQYSACSSFKVPLAVMAFDAGVLKDENQVLKWDGKRDNRPEVNKDHDAKTWMRDSVVWFSQRITPKLGKKKLQGYLDKFDYGNKDISAGIDDAWLVSPKDDAPALKISAYEQVEFLKNLWTDKLPASKRAMQLTRDITYLETSPNGFKLSGKTGSNFFNDERTIQLGWFISHIEKDGKEYIAVTNFRDLAPISTGGYGGPRAKEITKKYLAQSGLW